MTDPVQKNVSTSPARPRRPKQVGIVADRLVEGERVVRYAVISNCIYWQAIAVFVLAFFVALNIAPQLGALLAFVAVCMTIYAILRKEIYLLVITNRRIMARYGLLQVDVVDIGFDKVESMEMERMLTGYLMGYANLVIMGVGNRYIVIPYVANAAALRKSFYEMTINRSAEAPPTPVVIVKDPQA